MNKENVLFGVVGLLAGLIIGFMFANSVNQQAAGAAVTTSMKANSNMPPGHPDIGAMSAPAALRPEDEAAIEKAKISPEDFDAQVKAAVAYYQSEKYDEAINFLTLANKLRPDDREAIVLLGNASFDAERFEAAEKWYTTALAMKSDDVNVRTDLGLTFVFREQPDYDRAAKEFNRSLEIDPNHIQSLQNLTVAYIKKGDAAKAKATLERLEGVDPKNSAVAKLKEDISKIGTKS